MGVITKGVFKHVFRYVEKDLEQYLAYQEILSEWESRRNEILEEIGGSKPFDITGDRRSVGGKSDPVSSKALSILEEAEFIDIIKRHVRAIEDTLELLSEEDRRLIELKYFSLGIYTNANIAAQLHISERALARKRNELISRFALRMGLP